MALTEEQIEMLGARLVPLFQQLERDTINDIARRLMKTGRLTETAEIMAESLNLKGYSPSAIRREVMQLIRADVALQKRIEQDTLDYKKQLAQRIADMREELGEQDEGLWEDAGNLAFHEDLAVWKGDAKPVKGTAFEGLVKAMRTQTSGDLLNLTKSAGFRTPDGDMFKARQAYTSELNRAFVKLSSGAFSWQRCVEDAVRELAGSGLRTIDFDSGISRQIDTAVRNAVMTASAQLAGQISMQNAAAGDTDYVEVSSHWGARTGEGHANHAAWQGKVYKIHGSEPGYDNLEEATGYPSDPRGLLGYNCRHVFYPFWPGLSEPQEWPPEPAPVTVDGKTYTYYEATQEQRRREREIRALKREESALKAAGLDDLAKQKRSLIEQKAAEYEDFSKDVGIRAKNERLRVCETGSSTLTSGWKSGIINTRELANGLRSAKHKLTDDEIETIKGEIRRIKAEESVFVFKNNGFTGYSDTNDKVIVSGNVLPDESSPVARDRMSIRAVLAHEYYGHRQFRGTSLKNGSWNDEFRASYFAAINAPGLTDEDRQMLMRDAIDRASEAGVTIKPNAVMRRILYGY